MLSYNRELDSFLTLLDDTLHLPPVAREVTDTPSNTAVGHVSMRLGRLEDRIVRLRRELVAGIGHEMFYKAHHLLDTGSGDLEEAEVTRSHDVSYVIISCCYSNNFSNSLD